MTKNPITLGPHASVYEAWTLMEEQDIRHLPVMDGETLVGIATDRDLRLALPSPAISLKAHELHYVLDKLPVSKVMTAEVMTLPPSAPLDDAARLLMRGRIGALPVTDGGALVGILTRQDVMKAFVSQAEAAARRPAA
jgi:acetoin utilization protein AcuB